MSRAVSGKDIKLVARAQNEIQVTVLIKIGSCHNLSTIRGCCRNDE